MHAALWLVLVLAGVAAQYILLAAEFIAITQVLVYIGAIIVLFLFGIMLTRAEIGTEDRPRQRPTSRSSAASSAVLLARRHGLRPVGRASRTSSSATSTRAATAAGQRLDLLAPTCIAFEAISVLLLAALIGAIVLARRD